ncbi:MAG TPA: glycosyltransferase [Thermoplasmata archaeon]|nr:glycosyltransferase [Thermoplasmata archaeon]
MRVSVVVPTFHEEAGIEAFLRQFDEQTLARSEFEVILVDGGSGDRTREIAERHADRVILQTGEGIGGARNDGVAIAAAPIVATTDADCRLPRDWIERIARRFEDPGVVAVVGPDGPLEGGWKARSLFFLIRGLIRVAAMAGIYTTGGGNSAFRREAFLAVGGYRSLPHSDDVDLGLRIRARGRIVYDPGLFVRFSVRRLEKHGYARTLLTWLRGDVKLLAGREIDGAAYARQKY